MPVPNCLSFMAVALVTAASAPTQLPTAGAPKSVNKADFGKSVDSRFATLDADHDGWLDKAELAAAQAKSLQQALLAEHRHVESEFKKLDTNRDNSLSLAEFGAAAPPIRPSQTPDQMLQRLDTNKDGKVSAPEYRAPHLANFNKADANHDGILSPEELRAARKR